MPMVELRTPITGRLFIEVDISTSAVLALFAWDIPLCSSPWAR